MLNLFSLDAFVQQVQDGLSPIVYIAIGLVVLLVIIGLIARSMRATDSSLDNARDAHIDQDVPPVPSTANAPRMSVGPDAIPQTGGGVADAPPVTDTYTEIEEERIDTTPVTPPPYIPPAPDVVPPAPPEMVQHIAGDDFTLLNGISMRITEALNNAGIETFEQLAMSDPENLRTILQNAGFRLTDPTSWPEQARLAASGDMDALREYQRRLNDSGMV